MSYPLVHRLKTLTDILVETEELGWANTTRAAAKRIEGYDRDVASAEQRGAERAFKESANEVRREMRWQYEQNINRNSDTGDSIDRLLELEKVFKYRADQEGDE